MDNEKSYTLEELMSQTLAGNKAAYAELLKKTTNLLKPYLYKRLNQQHEVDDVMQEILISIHKAKHTYDATRPFLPWVYAIAKFRLKDRLRKFYNDPLKNAEDLLAAENISDSDVTESHLSYEYIKEEVNKLPPKQAKILSLMHEQGYTAKETAKLINMKESAVKVSAHRAYKILKKQLGNK